MNVVRIGVDSTGPPRAAGLHFARPRPRRRTRRPVARRVRSRERRRGDWSFPPSVRAGVAPWPVASPAGHARAPASVQWDDSWTASSISFLNTYREEIDD